MDRSIPFAANVRSAAQASLRVAGLAVPLAFLLSGCTEQRVTQLEERVAAVEAKADAADKRSKAAESIASRSADTPPVVELPPSNDNPDSDEDSPALADQNDGVLDSPPPGV